MEVKIKFENSEAADLFMLWLIESGEQYYWDWMRGAEEEIEGPVTATKIEYDFEELVITTKCGRLDAK